MIGDTLDWLANEGWSPYFPDHGVNYESSHEFRQRHLAHELTKAVKAMRVF